VELLVVIAILGLLMSILLPTMSAAREQARRSRCASNLRQIAYAWLRYLDEEANGVFPLARKVDRFNIHWFYGGKNEMMAGGGWYVLNPRPINWYMGLDPAGNRAAEIFHCPSDIGCLNLPDPVARTCSTYDYYGNSYPLNRTITQGHVDDECNRTTPYEALRLVDIEVSPSLFVLAADYQMMYTTWGNTQYRAFWHDPDGNFANMSFLDGHAAWIRMEWGVEWTNRYVLPYRWCERDP